MVTRNLTQSRKEAKTQRLELEVDGQAGAEGLSNRKRCSSRSSQIFKGDGRWATLQHNSANLAHFIGLPFVLTAEPAVLLPTTLIKRRRTKIIEHKSLAVAEDLNSLFRKRRIALSQVGDRAVRAICEAQRHKHGVFIDNLMILACDGFGEDSRG